MLRLLLYLRFWQSKPSGKQSFPVPLSGSLPQSLGKISSRPVAWGRWVPSSWNLGPGRNIWLKKLPMGLKKFCKALKNWASAWPNRQADKSRQSNTNRIVRSELDKDQETTDKLNRTVWCSSLGTQDQARGKLSLFGSIATLSSSSSTSIVLGFGVSGGVIAEFLRTLTHT